MPVDSSVGWPVGWPLPPPPLVARRSDVPGPALGIAVEVGSAFPTGQGHAGAPAQRAVLPTDPSPGTLAIRNSASSTATSTTAAPPLRRGRLTADRAKQRITCHHKSRGAQHQAATPSGTENVGLAGSRACTPWTARSEPQSLPIAFGVPGQRRPAPGPWLQQPGRRGAERGRRGCCPGTAHTPAPAMATARHHAVGGAGGEIMAADAGVSVEPTWRTGLALARRRCAAAATPVTRSARGGARVRGAHFGCTKRQPRRPPP
jgi:hypothetical protein